MLSLTLIFPYSRYVCLIFFFNTLHRHTHTHIRNGFSGRGFKSHSGQLSLATSKNSPVVNTICIRSFHYTHVITSTKFQLKINMVTDKGNSQNETWHLTNRWNWSTCTKLALNANWTHGLIAQSVKVSEWYSVVVGSKATHTNFL